MLEVRVHGVRGLRPAAAFGLTSPSVQVVVGASSQLVAGVRFASPQPKDSALFASAPLRFDVTDANTRAVLLRVFDTDTAALLGEAQVFLAQLAHGQPVTAWMPLGGLGGEVHVTLIPPSAHNPAHNLRASQPAQAPFQPLVQPTVVHAPPVELSPGLKRAETHLFSAQQTKLLEQRNLMAFRPDQIRRDMPRLAKGGFGEVFTGWAEGIPFKIVIKDQEVQSEQSVAEWRKEIELMRQLRSAHVAEVFGYASALQATPPTLTIVMEYFPFGDLFGVLHKKADKHPLSMLQRMRMARHCALGFSVLHGQRIMHRDVKSMNILVTEDYACKLTDFGCSKLLGSQPSLMTMGTGTLLWMAPEVKHGHVYGYPADMYSLGIVLYEIFERKLPDFDMVKGISMPAAFRSSPLVLPCVSVEPERRPTIAQLLKALDDVLRNTLSAAVTQLPQSTQAEIARQHGADDLEQFLVAVYKSLLARPPAEVDALIERAFASPPPAALAQPAPQPRSLAQSQPAQTPPRPAPQQQEQLVQRHLAPMQAASPLQGQGHARLAQSQPAQPALKGHPHSHAHAQSDVTGERGQGQMLVDLSSDDEDGAAPLNKRKRALSVDDDSAPLVAPGSIRLVVERANGVKAADVTGKSDPYCKLLVNGAKYKTPKVVQSLDPVWNYALPLPSATREAQLYLECWDYDPVGSHDFLGIIEEKIDTTKDGTYTYALQPRPGKKDKKISGTIVISVKR